MRDRILTNQKQKKMIKNKNIFFARKHKGLKDMIVRNLLILFICIGAVILYFYFQKKDVLFIESFVGLNNGYVDAMYKEKGLEPCTGLSHSNYMSSNYIDTMRIGKWKPTEGDSHYKDYMTSSNSDYCYFFMDDKQILKTDEEPNGYAPIADPLSTVMSCDKGHSLFRDINFVTDVFESTGFDATHTLPYKKCVLKMNSEGLSNQESVGKLWDKFSGANNNAFCEGMVNTLQNEAGVYMNEIKKLDEQLKPYRLKYISVSKLSTSLSNCTATNIQLNSDIKISSTKLSDLQLQIVGSNKTGLVKIEDIRKRLDTVTSEVNAKQSGLTQLANNFKFITTPKLNSLLQAISDIMSKKTVCITSLSSVTAALDALQKNYDIKTKQFQQINLDLASCERQMRELLAQIALKTPIYDDVVQKLKDLQIAVYQCQVDQSKLLQEEQFWKDKLRITTENYNKCVQARATLEANIASEKLKKDAFMKEIEEIKRRCRDDQSSFNLSTVDIHRDAAKEIISTEQQRCAASIAMRKRKTELLNELNGIANQVNNCDRVVATCKCFKVIASFGWNDRGSRGGRAETTSGRIVEIRKYVDASPYIKFVNGSVESGPYRITKTRKKKGSGSYIDVAGTIHKPNGTPFNSVIMLQQV
jgi:hypothetical protein